MNTYRLTRGGETLAILRPDGQFLVPEIDGHFTIEAAYTTTEAFESVRHLFERDAELLDAESDEAIDEEADIWDELQEPGLFVESEDGREKVEVMWIHFKYGRAWWWPLYGSQDTG